MNKVIGNIKTVLLGMTLLLVFSCSNDKENPTIEEQTVTSKEVKTIIDVDSQSSAIDQIITDLFENGQSGKSSKMEDCYLTEYSDTGYTVTFDDCSVDGSDTINGILTVTYKVGEEESAFTAAYSDVSVGAIVINGTRDFTIESDEGGNVLFDIVTDMSIQLEDGSLLEEVGTKNLSIVLDIENLENSTLKIEGNWTLKTDGDTFVINITSPLTTNILNCEYISKGVMSLNKNGLGVTVDFGDGTCDDVASLTYPNGTVEEISLKDQ